MTKVIDGRKAEITNPGRRYRTYKGFANRHGYPEAAAESDRSDKRIRPKKGDIVTLLVSGPHEWDAERTLWIVEATNGERYIINEAGLRIIDEDSAGVTALPDESLGGVLREYREVKRKAAVGDRIKYVWPGQPMRYNFAKRSREESVDLGDPYVNEEEDEVTGWARDAYVVLEPTEILVIDGTRYRTVDRKAAVGERVIATEHCTINPDNYRPGSVFTALDSDFFGVDITDLNGEPNAIPESHYRVLEPVVSAESTLLSDRPTESPVAANIASLALRLTQAEAKIAALESVIAERKVASGPVETTQPTLVKSAQQIRDEIVERAKADVLDMRKFSGTKIPNDCIAFWPETKLPHAYIPMHTVWFEVNRAKRTVVAIIRCDDDGLITRGISKCAPGETFNSHIGRAIALRRALGLEVPAEYLNAPQPEEARKGDIVRVDYDAADPFRTVDRPHECGNGVWFTNGYWVQRSAYVITDDSREGLALSPRKEAA